MTPGIRGWIVVALVVVVSALAGWNAGGLSERGKWERWTYAHVAWDSKGDAK